MCDHSKWMCVINLSGSLLRNRPYWWGAVLQTTHVYPANECNRSALRLSCTGADENLRRTATHCNKTLQHTATHYNTLQHATHTWRVRVNWVQSRSAILRPTRICNTLQHTATHYCNTLQQHTATHCNAVHHTATHTWRMRVNWVRSRSAVLGRTFSGNISIFYLKSQAP